MSDCHDLFISFHDHIYLSQDEKNQLRKSRNALRQKIRKHFTETLGFKEPLFYGQGSYSMNTTIVPINGEFDIDDGVYLEHLKDKDEDDWNSPSKVHQWIVDAVDGHTDTPPEDKLTCVRVIYKNEYHIDFPIYVKRKDEHPKLAHRSKGWIDSDPKLLTEWFNGEVSDKGNQLKRIVRYLKAWKDKKEGEVKMPSGMFLTILAANDFEANERDDIALVETAKRIYDTLNDDYKLVRPVFPGEDLFEDWSVTRRDNFLNKLNDLIQKGNAAVAHSKKSESSEKWIKVFGDRFPEYDGDDTDSEQNSVVIKSSIPPILGNHGRSA
ncbi:CBASS cGAMP synthase [Paenibacillus sp. 843]|uniref:CBASS cGAMP synthase n=1 Tax=Paenibacillus sp. 843 TaxID=3341795 RepID=UPI003728744D